MNSEISRAQKTELQVRASRIRPRVSDACTARFWFAFVSVTLASSTQGSVTGAQGVERRLRTEAQWKVYSLQTSQTHTYLTSGVRAYSHNASPDAKQVEEREARQRRFEAALNLPTDYTLQTSVLPIDHYQSILLFDVRHENTSVLHGSLVKAHKTWRLFLFPFGAASGKVAPQVFQALSNLLDPGEVLISHQDDHLYLESDPNFEKREIKLFDLDYTYPIFIRGWR